MKYGIVGNGDRSTHMQQLLDAMWIATRDYESKPNPDAVYISTPPWSHASISKYWLERGVHVLVEKPLCTNLKDALKLYELAEDHHVTLMEVMGAHNQRPELSPQNIKATLGFKSKTAPNPIHDLGVYLVYLALWINGLDVISVEAKGSSFSLDWSSGLHGDFVCSTRIELPNTINGHSLMFKIDDGLIVQQFEEYSMNGFIPYKDITLTAMSILTELCCQKSTAHHQMS